MADETQTPGPRARLKPKAGRGGKTGLGLLGGARKDQKIKIKKFKNPDSDVIMLKMVEEGPANKHKSTKFEKMKKTTNKDGNIEFVELKAKGGRAGYKGGGMSQRGLGRAFMKGGKV